MGINQAFQKLGVKADLDKERSGHFDLEEENFVESKINDFVENFKK